jgi:anthranilate synthase/aminodeoxychorismate synthase-like glutamine amidotransferase
MILLIDNYDSFTYNLYHYLVQAYQGEVIVKRNDKISLEEIEKLNLSAIVISPGPCAPDDAGICLAVIKKFAGKIPILGVCLGHQAIGQAFGGKIIKTHPMHGKISEIFHYQENLFKNISSPFNATRYHSLIIERETIPKNLKITAQTSDNIIMAIADEKLRIYGVQFHPESIACEHGIDIIKNFINIVKDH